jgi:hypothetical protein
MKSADVRNEALEAARSAAKFEMEHRREGSSDDRAAAVTNAVVTAYEQTLSLRGASVVYTAPVGP